MTIDQWFARKGLKDATLPKKAKALGVGYITFWRFAVGKTATLSPDTMRAIVKSTGGEVAYEDLIGRAK